MVSRLAILRVYCLCLCLSLIICEGEAQQPPKDNFVSFVENLRRQILTQPDRTCSIPTPADLRSWTKAFHYFRMNALDSCRAILAKQNYSLVQLADHRTGAIYDVFRENPPIKKSWGTFVYNRHHAKRLFIYVTHPVDDRNVAEIGASLFQDTRAEWLYIAGSRKSDDREKISFDAARTSESLLQRWHEMFTDLTHITLSLHGFEQRYYRGPICSSDIVLSNGKTSDEQWGISQISLTYRDSLRSGGFACGVAMYDSGFATLRWGVSPQGMFSNDSVGFGHWVNIELSNALRSNEAEYERFVALTDRAFEVTGQKISKQVNRAFGLVSPRTLRLDAKHGLLFPPSTTDSYRIVSFNSAARGGDTISIRVGSWLRFPGASRGLASIANLDSSEEGIVQRLRRSDNPGVHSAIAKIVEQESPGVLSPYLHFQNGTAKDTVSEEEGEMAAGEPMQVHRIPLQPQGGRAPGDVFAAAGPSYLWQGSVGVSPITYLQFGRDQGPRPDEQDPPNFLIPIINRSYDRQENPFVGVRMSRRLVQQIARLVAEHNEESRDVQLLAEETGTGDYYLRVFPAGSPK